MAIPWNLLIPAATSAVGGAMSLFGKKRPAQTTQLPRFNPEQQRLMQQSGQMAMEGMQNPTAGFEPIAQKARSDFQTQTLPSLAERFTSMGQGGQRSSDYRGAQVGAGVDLEESLASMASQYGLQRQGQLQQLLGMGLTPQFENMYQPERMGAMQGMGGELMSGGLGSLFSGIAQKQQSDDAKEKLKTILGFLRSTQDNKQNTGSFGSGFGSNMENLLYSGFRG